MKRNNYWHLLWVIAKTDFKMRYNGSVFGYIWALLKPLLMFLVLYIVFSVLMKWDVPNFQLYLLLGIIIWNFFAEGTMAGLSSLLGKGEMIKKIYFPRILIVVASTLTAFMTLCLNILIFFVFYGFSDLSFHFTMLLVPLYLIFSYIFVLGLSLFLSVLQVRYRDIVQIWEVLLQAGFFLTPIIYPITLVPEKYLFYLFLNPVTGLIQYSRVLMMDGTLPSLYGSVYLLTGILLIFAIGLLVFSKLSRNIAEKL
ncbi:MAG: ABC transporter permease [Candidatus Gracilibacteria bacterium]|nr:ABC transporter permease [Candidatus Gracilibacteria bacterium]